MKYRNEESAAFQEQAREHFRELFRAAHAITGNLELAELTLGGALLTAYLNRHEWQGRVGNREGMMRAIRSVAALEMQNAEMGEYEEDWDGLTAIAPADARHPQIAEHLAAQSAIERRAVTLRYGCRMDARHIERLMRLSEDEVLSALHGVERAALCCSAQTGKQSSRAAERALIQTVRADMVRRGDDLPDIGLILREVERDAAGREDRQGAPRRVASVLLALIGVAVCAALFWLLAILLESPIRGRVQTQTQSAVVESAHTEAPSPETEGEQRVQGLEWIIERCFT